MMRAILTSVGEPTTEIAFWALARNGFEVMVYKNGSSLWDKLQNIYNDIDEDFIRVDADVIVNRNCTPNSIKCDDDTYWVQYLTFDWFKQDITHGGVQFIKKQALPTLRKHIGEAKHMSRPESYMFRLEAFHNPRRCSTENTIMGLHGYANDVKRVKETKSERNQYDNYDWELYDRISKL